MVWLSLAGEQLDDALDRFRDNDSGGFFDTASDAERLVVRPQDPTDNATPSGWASTASALLTYAALSGSQAHRDAADESLAALVAMVAQHPRFAGHAAATLAAWLDGPREVAVVVPELATDSATVTASAIVHAARAATAPGSVVVVGHPGSAHPLLADRPMVDGHPTAYVCRHFACDAPTTDPATLARTLRTPG